MSRPLTKEEVRKSMQELRNVKHLHKQARKRVQTLEAESKILKARIKELEHKDKENNIKIETLALQVEELRTMVFGRKNNKNGSFLASTTDKVVRTKDSYKRTIPREDEITETRHHPINHCPDCTTPLHRMKVVVFYEEDILLPVQKQIIKHKVEKGYCSLCKQWSSAVSLPPKKVILGEKVKRYICYLSILLRMSYSQVRQILQNMYGMEVSDGEIARILEYEAIRLNPSYEQLKENIRKESGVHMDETGWNVQKGTHGNHAWVMSGTDTPDAVFTVGRSRGKGVAEELLGNSDAVLISDDYGVYKNLSINHQLCWSHPFRKIRDLVQSNTISEKKRGLCIETYKQFSKLYEQLENVRKQPVCIEKRKRIHKTFTKKLTALAQPNTSDPDKLRRIKQSLIKNTSKYFTCLLHKNIPADNNKAERALRHLVIKRKLSFGSRTEKGAYTTSVLLSVLYSLQQKYQHNFFTQYMAL